MEDRVTAPRIVIVVLILIVVLFVTGIGLGVRNGDGSDRDAKPGWLTRLQSIVNHPKMLSTQDITAQPATCIVNQTLTIAAGATCNYAVPKAKADIPRRAGLTLNAGTAVNVKAFENGDPNLMLTPDKTLPDGGKRDLDIDFYKNGGTLRLTCVGLSACRVTLRS
jgi:hypothetical protein